MTKKSYYPNPEQNFDFPKMEEEILKFWQENKIFEKSVSNRDFSAIESEEDNVSPASCCTKSECSHKDKHERNEFVFYDGPPFANGLPHYGHLLTGYIKDIFARYQAMKGKKVERKFGWDTHGLPVEMETEKELGVSGQIAIGEYGIEKFNAACQKSVMKYAGEWQNYVSRQGRWVDFENGYKTMDINYMESVIWAFKQLYDKGLMYEDYRVVPYSWACQTPLSNFETKMDNAYRKKESKAVTVKFELETVPEFLINCEFVNFYKKKGIKMESVSLIAWTTTPWTLPSNLALAVNKNHFLALGYNKEHGFCIAERQGLKKLGFTTTYQNQELTLVQSIKNSDVIRENKLEHLVSEDLEGIKNFESEIIRAEFLTALRYKPLFPYLIEKTKNNPKAFTILHGDFVTTEEGTGIVHMAPGFGEDDQLLCKANGIPTLCPVDEGGKFTNEIFDLENLSIKGRQVFETNDDIIKYLKATGAWLKTEQYIHNYPHCWRTDTPLIYKAVSSWYVEVTKIRDRMVELNSGRDFSKIERDENNKIYSIETKRMLARPISQQYFSDLAKMYGDPEVRKYYYFCDEQVLSEDSSKYTIEYYANYYNRTNLPRLVLFDKKTGEFLGTAGLAYYDPRKENLKDGIEISYQLPKSAWGKGYATEITKILTNYCFDELGVDGVCAATVSDNEASKKVLLKCGFKFIRSGKNTYPKASIGKNYEEHYFELSKADWNALQKPGINWIPDHIKDGQFGKWLEGARDWSITRNRFWGCPVPVWRSNDPTYPRLDVYGSLEEIERDFGVRPDNLHRPFIDNLTRPNPNDPTGKSKMIRVLDVLDCWFESGSMPYAQAHYPFENKEWFENNFPADFITEYVAQTRGWFYTLTVLSVALFDRVPFKNVICHGTILDEHAQKLSKRLKNYPDPLEVFSNYGSDAMRFYLVSQAVMRGQELKIDKDGKAIRDTLRISIKPLINAYNFFCLYANADEIKAERITDYSKVNSVMDRYILSKLKTAVTAIDKSLANFDSPSACSEFDKFFEVLNNWYIRRSRGRFWKNEIDGDKVEAYNTLYTALITMCEASASLLPFTTEKVWRDLVNSNFIT